MNRLLIPLCIAAALALPGCGPDPGEESASRAEASPATAPDIRQPGSPQAPTAGPEDAVPGAGMGGAQMPAEGVIGFGGFGPASFGAGQEAVRMAWGRDLGDAAPAEPGGCHYLAPQPRPDAGRDRIGFMIDDDRFVRLDVAAPDIQAPGGGRVGMSADEIRDLYGEAVDERPHKYLAGGHYLRIPDPGGGEAVLLFETGADGQASEWRIGLPPQVDWVERCG